MNPHILDRGPDLLPSRGSAIWKAHGDKDSFAFSLTLASLRFSFFPSILFYLPPCWLLLRLLPVDHIQHLADTAWGTGEMTIVLGCPSSPGTMAFFFRFILILLKFWPHVCSSIWRRVPYLYVMVMTYREVSPVVRLWGFVSSFNGVFSIHYVPGTVPTTGV